MIRFNRELVVILNCPSSLSVRAFTKGLDLDCDLYRELLIYPCHTMDDALSKAWALIKWDEDEPYKKAKHNNG